MAQINICDRCRKELTSQRTFLTHTITRHGLKVQLLKYLTAGMIKPCEIHTFELCDSCANELGEFLKYTGPVEEETNG